MAIDFQARLERKSYALLLLGLAAAGTLRYLRFSFGEWVQITSTFSYSYGFIQRALIGTICELVADLLHLPLNLMWYIYTSFTVAAFLMILVICIYKALGVQFQNRLTRKMLMALGILFFAGPGWSTWFHNFGHSDTWLIINTIICLWLLYKDRYWAAVAVPLVCLMIHPGYIFMYYGEVVAILFYKFTTCEKERRRYLPYGVFSLVVCGGVFLYFQCFSHVKPGTTLEYVVQRAEECMQTEINPGTTTFIKEYLFGEKPELSLFLLFRGFYYFGWYLLIALVLYAPFFYELTLYFRNVINACTERSLQSFFYRFVPWIGIIAIVPMFFSQTDYGRWSYAVFFYEFCLLFYFNLKEDDCFLKATAALRERMHEKRLWFIFLFAYWITLGCIKQNPINDIISQLFSFFEKLVQIAKGFV